MFATSVMNRVSMNGRNCKGEVTEACYREPRDYLCIFFIISAVTVSKVSWTALQFFTTCEKMCRGKFIVSKEY